MKKRLLSALLAMCMVMTMAPAAFATDDESQSSSAQTKVVLPDGITAESFGKNTVYDGTTFHKTMMDALKAVAGKEDAVLYCKPDADVGTMNHGHVCASLTVYGNGAFVSGGENDFEVDTYSGTGCDAHKGCLGLQQELTITINALNNSGVWGQRTSNHTINIVMNNCKNADRVYLTGTTGINNITITGNTYTGLTGENKDVHGGCAIYSNAAGEIKIDGCEFNGVKAPINLNHKSAGKQSVTVSNTTFTNCALLNGLITDDEKSYISPIRVLTTNESGSSALQVDSCTFEYTSSEVKANGDILIGDGRADATTNSNVTVSISNTASEVQFQAPRYHDANGGIANESNLVTMETKKTDSVDTSLVESFAVAKIDDQYYYTLKDALLSLANSQMETVEVELLNDQNVDGFTVDLSKSAIKNLTIVGNGKKLDSHVENGNQDEVPRLPTINLHMAEDAKLLVDSVEFPNSLIFDDDSAKASVTIQNCTFHKCQVGYPKAKEITYDHNTFSFDGNWDSEVYNTHNAYPLWFKAQESQKIKLTNNTVTGYPRGFHINSVKEMGSQEIIVNNNTFKLESCCDDHSNKRVAFQLVDKLNGNIEFQNNNVDAYMGVCLYKDIAVTKNAKLTIQNNHTTGKLYGSSEWNTAGDTEEEKIAAADAFAKEIVEKCENVGNGSVVTEGHTHNYENGVCTICGQKKPSSGGGSSSGGSSGGKTETTTNPDGSTTTTVTKPDGSKTETTKYPDGSKEVVETKKDGTTTTTTTDKEGNKTETVEKTDGSSTTKVENKDGSTSTTTVSKNGEVETTVKLPHSVIDDAKGNAVLLPMAEAEVTKDADKAPTVTVDTPSGETVKVEVPVKDVTAGTVAILVKKDGTEEVIKTTVMSENGVIVTLSDGDTIKIVDNSRDFVDVADNSWYADEVDFVTSRELFSGTSETMFSPNDAMTRAMIVTVLARLDGEDTTGGATWYEIGRKWAMENGISDGSGMMNRLTREQLVAMLWRYAGNPTTEKSLVDFKDAGSVSGYAQEAFSWAVEQGIITGMTADTLNPKGEATRAQVASILMRFCENIAK